MSRRFAWLVAVATAVAIATGAGAVDLHAQRGNGAGRGQAGTAGPPAQGGSDTAGKPTGRGRTDPAGAADNGGKSEGAKRPDKPEQSDTAGSSEDKDKGLGRKNGAGKPDFAGRPDAAGKPGRGGDPADDRGRPAAFNGQLTRNTRLASRVAGLFPEGTDLSAASAGFKNLGQFVAAAHVSRNLGIPFDALKARMTGSNAVSLGQAIQELSPQANANTEAAKAEREADDDLD